MPDMTLSTLERAAAAAAEHETDAFAMDEEAFRLFYEKTSRPVWAYLSRVTGDRQQADDLLQETYYRFLRSRREYESDAHRQNALFRIATNLLRDAYRRQRRRPLASSTPAEDLGSTGVDEAGRAVARTDVTRAMARLRPRERQLLWLAYAQELSHREIAAGLGLKTASIKLLLWRARRRLMAVLRGSEERR
jgi:RNA polymerase sigma-70 factor (ECF subfamily)